MAYKKICEIYKITNLVNGKIYIGQSISIKARWCQHKSQLNKNIRENEHLQNAWNKYGEENFIFEIIEECLCEELNDKEIYWIKHYDSMNKKYGYNKASGGSRGKEVSDETRKKLSESNMYIHRGENSERAKYTEKQIKLTKMLIYCGMDFGEINKITNIPTPYISKIKNLDKWSYTLEELNEEIKSIGRISYQKQNSVPVIMFDKKMNILKKFKSTKEAAKENKVCVSQIWSCCSGKSLMSNNYIYLYENDDLNMNIHEKKNKLKENKIYIVHMIDEQENILETFNTISDIVKIYNLDASAINKVCEGKLKTTKGYRFVKEYV